jgi:hypothetical protein
MKKIIVLLAVLWSLQSMSQPTLSSTDFTFNGVTTFYSAFVTGFNNGPSGANVVWDYSTAQTAPISYTMSVIPVDTAPNHTAYPTANYCEKFDVGATSSYTFYNLNGLTFENLGDFSNNTIYHYYDTEILFQFPFNYNDLINDTDWSGGPEPPAPFSRQYDAYGTLITPNTTYNNVIRIKCTDPFGQIFYEWIATNPYRLLLRGNFETSGSTVTFSGDTIVLNTSEISTQNKYVISPNPTSDEFSITIPPTASNFKASVCDVSGRQIINQNITADSKISLKEYEAGIYFVSIRDENNKVVSTQKIIRK